jgi:hypothetical protein
MMDPREKIGNDIERQLGVSSCNEGPQKPSCEVVFNNEDGLAFAQHNENITELLTRDKKWCHNRGLGF